MIKEYIGHCSDKADDHHVTGDDQSSKRIEKSKHKTSLSCDKRIP